MALSENLLKRLAHALGDKAAAEELATLVGRSELAAGSWKLVTTIQATAASTTTDFGSLLVGDRVTLIPAIAGSADYGTVVTAGTAPFTPAVGDLVVVYRAVPAAASITL